MLRTNYLAFVAAVVVAFVFSSLYYGVFAQEMTKLHAAKAGAAADMMAPAPWKVLVEVGRTITIVYVLALLVGRLGIDDWKGAMRLAVMLWIAFSFVMWVGAIIWENVPVKLAAIHAGDWLIKTTLIAVIVAVWRR